LLTFFGVERHRDCFGIEAGAHRDLAMNFQGGNCETFSMPGLDLLGMAAQHSARAVNGVTRAGHRDEPTAVR
jgi:hypothetical protein